METHNCAKRIVIGMQRTTFTTCLKSSEKGDEIFLKTDFLKSVYVLISNSIGWKKTFKCSQTH